MFEAVPCTYINITRFTTCRVYVGIIIWTLFKELVSFFHYTFPNTSSEATGERKSSFCRFAGDCFAKIFYQFKTDTG